MVSNNITQQPMIAPSYLWIGSHDQLVQKAISFLKKLLCHHTGDDHCINCELIARQQHHATIWLMPEKQYTLKQLESITYTTSLSLPHDQYRFFIVQYAHLLSDACANSLLKIIEEPPRGNHFIFLAETLDAIPSTIQSRCLIQSHKTASHNKQTHLLFVFLTESLSNITGFEKALNESKINERESISLFNDVLHYWMQQYKNAIIASPSLHTVDTAEKIIQFLMKKSETLPMPGSSAFFWKDIFLFIHRTKTLNINSCM